MVFEHEVGVVGPDRSAQLEGDRPWSLTVTGNEVQLGGDHPSDVVEGRRRVSKYADRADVHVSYAVLQVEELGIEHAHSLHRAPPSPVGDG